MGSCCRLPCSVWIHKDCAGDFNHLSFTAARFSRWKVTAVVQGRISPQLHSVVEASRLTTEKGRSSQRASPPRTCWRSSLGAQPSAWHIYNGCQLNGASQRCASLSQTSAVRGERERKREQSGCSLLFHHFAAADDGYGRTAGLPCCHDGWWSARIVRSN